jgi:hypothetical protein
MESMQSHGTDRVIKADRRPIGPETTIAGSDSVEQKQG